MKTKSKKNILPSAKLILKILNQDKDAKEEVVDFYERYIKEMATEPVYSKDGARKGYFYNEDLAQELRIALAECLPALRKALIKCHYSDCPVVLVVADLSK